MSDLVKANRDHIGCNKPDSIFERSRISLISWIRSSPQEWIVFAYLHLFFVKVAFRVFKQLLCKDQQTIQRCTQLMRHIRQELRFIFRGKRKLFGFFFQRSCLFTSLF